MSYAKTLSKFILREFLKSLVHEVGKKIGVGIGNVVKRKIDKGPEDEDLGTKPTLN